MAPAKEEKKSATNVWLLAALVVVVTGGLIYLMGSGDPDAAAEQSQNTAQPADREEVEVSPLIPRGNIASASWRTKAPAAAEAAAAAKEEGDRPFSLLDGFESEGFGGKDAEERKRMEGIEKVVDNIHGLGVYVEPAGEDDEVKDK
jgi:hypothetical protein